jgi:hypothetical protein
MKEPEKSLVHEHARESDQAEAESNFGFGKVGFKHGGLLFRIPVDHRVRMANSWSASASPSALVTVKALQVLGARPHAPGRDPGVPEFRKSRVWAAQSRIGHWGVQSLQMQAPKQRIPQKR